MQKKIGSVVRVRAPRWNSFTLIELLVVMAIIGILAALVLAAGNGVMQKSMRSRSTAEIQAMSTALESYKTDNGIYPVYYNPSFVTNTYQNQDSSQSGSSSIYVLSSEALYLALSGQTNFSDVPAAGTKSYMTFKANQVGLPTALGASAPGSTTYVKDPWNYSYGYSTGTNTATPYNGNGFFDLWSTGGKKGTTAANTNSWISNWQ